MAAPKEQTSVTTWHPSQLLSPSSPEASSTPFSLIVLNQPLALRPVIYQAIFSRAKHIVAADGGANRLHNLAQSLSPRMQSQSEVHLDSKRQSLDPTLIIGDLDSLLPSVRTHFAKKGIEIVQDDDQYSTDFGKAHAWLRSQQGEGGEREGDLEMGKQDIVVLGGLGGRVDQGLSVIHHLYMFQAHDNYAQGKMYLVSSESITFLLKKGRHRVKVKDGMMSDENSPLEGQKVQWGLGKHVGIIPMKEACVITTKGLEWDVQDWKTEMGGLLSTSNWVREEWVDVETSGDVLFTIDIKVVEEGENVEA